MGRLTPGQRLCPVGHCASQSLASSQQERVGSAVLGKTWSAWDCSTKIHSGSQTTHTEFSCYVVQLEAVSIRAAPEMGNKGIKQGREKGVSAPVQTLLPGFGKASAGCAGLTHCPPLAFQLVEGCHE